VKLGSLPALARASVVACLASALGGCHGDGAPRLQGHWRGVRAEGVPSESLAAANAFATGTELQVKGDSITVITPKDRRSGRYKVVRQDKTTLVMTTDKDGPSEPQTFTFVDDKTIRWAILEGKFIVLSKQ
jgi:hypothetical protein